MSPGRMIYTFYLDWQRAVTEQSFIPADINDEFPHKCAALWVAGYYTRTGGRQTGLPRSNDHILVCNALFDRYNADDRPDREWRRSMSVGDIVQIDRAFYVCRSIGWQQLDVNAES